MDGGKGTRKGGAGGVVLTSSLTPSGSRADAGPGGDGLWRMMLRLNRGEGGSSAYADQQAHSTVGPHMYALVVLLGKWLAYIKD